MGAESEGENERGGGELEGVEAERPESDESPLESKICEPYRDKLGGNRVNFVKASFYQNDV